MKTQNKCILAACLSAVVLSGSLMTMAEAQDTKAPENVAAAPAAAQKTQSGLASIILKEGTGGEKPSASDKVTVHYTGWTTDGKMFDSSVERGTPATFGLNQVIKGWTEGLQLMVEGEKRRFWIPADLAYGENPGSGRPGGTLCFDVELLSFVGSPKAPADVAAAPADAQKTDSGLASKVLTKGKGGEKPQEHSVVTVHYSGWTTDGNLFDSSVVRDAPATFPLNRVIAGWTEGVQLMEIGEQRRFWIPADLAYGEDGPPGAPKGTLCFDVELLSFETPPPPPKAPADVAAAPADAETTQSGLSSKVIKKGSGSEKPSAESTVEVHYTGWTTDGKMFDSSVERGQTATFPLNQVIAGWTEGLQLMVEGEQRRFWIPADLAYGENPGGGRPGGMLCFDVELVSIK